MGVHGLWKLLEPSGQMVPLESLAGKVLAVDISLWLHQAMKGMHDAHGAPVAVAHILILFHRLCKLLFYKIKPVFVFDGGVPTLKKQTMAARRQQSSAAKKEALKVREKLIKNLLKHEAVRQVLSNETASAALGLNSFTLPGPSVEEDLYKLPPIATDYYESGSSEEVSSSDEEEERRAEDIHSIDVTSKEFLSLPPEVRHDILTELIDTRKQSSWKHLDAMPKQSDCFSDFQMDRLLKRRAVQTSLEKAGKEMGGRALSLKELETLLGDRGVFESKDDFSSRRIAQDSVTRYMLVQRNPQENVSQEKDVKEENFDIMNHLNEIAWSSDSDTDIILKDKPIVKDKPVQLNVSSDAKLCDIKEDQTKQNVEVKTESFSTQPKIRMTKEIAEILTVLEGGTGEDNIKIKIEELKNKINIIDSSEQETKELVKIEKTLEEENPEESSSETKEVIRIVGEKTRDSTLPVCEIKSEEDNAEEDSSKPKEVIQVVGEKTDDTTLPICEVKTEEQTVSDEEVKGQSIATEESKTENENPCIPVQKLDDKQEPSVSNVDSINDSSSSDSESDFIPISDAAPESIPSTSDDMKVDRLSVLESNKTDSEKGESLTVTINPSGVNESDDLFADVFRNNERNNGEEKEEDDDDEKEEVGTSNNDSLTKDKSEEYADSINEYKELEEKISTGDLENLKESLENEQYELMLEQGKQERHALNLTDQMYSDAQELLRLFGIPFVVAPMEAEAQCAVLNLIGLTEGTITDDSDIWLFGGRVVYKNFFNQNKHVLEFRSENIHKCLKLSREDLIRMALLVGSDYTLGLTGVGPVTALEILASFKSSKPDVLDGLQNFRDWYTGRSKTGPPRVTLKKKIKNAVLTPGFPSKAVVEAYLHPQVDDSKEPFSWAKPNLSMIQKYTKMKMGWSSEKCSEMLLPVLKKLEENTNQYTMEKYFKVMNKTTSPEGVFSKRVETAIKRLGSDSVEETEVSSKRKRRRKCKEKEPVAGSSNDVEEIEDNANLNPAESVERNVSRKTRESSGTDFKTKIINERLHKDLKVPQKEMTQKMLEERKKQAIRLFKTYKKGGKKKIKVFAKEEAKLSESSSEDD